MRRELVIGLDIGTTSVKAVLFNVKGRLIADAEELITTHYPLPDWAEQNPVKIERSAVHALSKVIQKGDVQKEELLTVGISCAMHSVICINDEFEPMSPMIIWSDGRASEQADKLMKNSGHSIYLKTGTPIHPMSPFVKLMWMKETKYKPYQQAAYFMTMKEYLLQKWFHKRVIDYSMASSTGLFNLLTQVWDHQALAIAGVNQQQLSEIVPPTKVLTGMNKKVAREIGIDTDIPFVVGAADGQLANLGSGSISKGEVNISAGTSGAIRQFINGSRVNQKQETFTYGFTKNLSIIGGASNNGGIALQWLKELLEFQGSYNELIKTAEKIDPGADGLIFLPYINGERAPLWNGRAKGNFYGLNIGHKKEHLVRAILEGITFNLYQIGKSLEVIAGKPLKINVNGGLSKSDLWVQIVADIFGKEIHVSNTHHNAAWGAAWLALVGIKKAKSFEEIKKNMPEEKIIKPNLKNHNKYIVIYDKYEKLARSISAFFK